MYGYTAATLAIRAKCSLSFQYLSLPNDQQFYCHHPCCHFSASPRILTGYLLGLSSPIPSKTLFLAGRRKLRVLYRSRDSDMMGLLAESEKSFPGLGKPLWKKGRREIPIESIEGERQISRNEGKAGVGSSRSDVSSLARDFELNKVGSRRAGGESLAGYVYSRKYTRCDAVHVTSGEVREVHKYADLTGRERRNCSKRDVVFDSRNDDSTKINDSFKRLGVKDVEKVDQRANLSQLVNVRESGSDGRSKKVTGKSEVQLDAVKRTSIVGNVMKNQKGESSVSAAKQNSVMDHQLAGYDQLRRNSEKESIIADFPDVQSDAYPQRDFKEPSIRGRGERVYLEQNSAQVSREKRICLSRQTAEQEESRRSTRLNVVSLFHGSESSDIESASRMGDKSSMEMNAITNLVQDSSHVSKNNISQMDTELSFSGENRYVEREEKLNMEGNSIQLRGGERKQIHRGTVEHNEVKRKIQMVSEVSEVHCGNMEELYEKRGMESGSYFVQSSIPATKDKGTQVEMHDECYDQIEMSGFNANSIVNAVSSLSPPVSRVDPQEYDALLASHLVPSIREQTDQANRHAYLLYDVRMESEKDSSEFDLTRIGQFDKSSASHAGDFADKLQKEVVTLNVSGKAPKVSAGIQIGKPGWRDAQATLRIENQNETSSAETSSMLLTQERKESHSSLLLGENSQYKTMQITSTGSLGDVCSSFNIYKELDKLSGRDDILHVTNDAIESAKRLDKSSASHVDEFVEEIQQEIMSLNESGKEPNVSTRFKIKETGWRESQATAGMQVCELTESRGYGDCGHIKKGRRLSSSGSGMRGPSDEMWGVEVLSSQETSNAEEAEENPPTSGAMNLTTSTLETAITSRSPKSLWSYVVDIMRMSWILRQQSHSSTSKSDKRPSSNESFSSEAWFSGPEPVEDEAGPEPDEDGVGDESQSTKQTGLVKEPGLGKESDKLIFEESIKRDRLTVIEPNSSIPSVFRTSGLSESTAPSSVEAENIQDSKSTQDTLSNVAIVQQQLESKSDAASPSIVDILESRVRDKVKLLKPCSSYPAAVLKVGFSSSITQAISAEQMDAANVGEGNNCSLENFVQPSVSSVNSALPGIAVIEEVDRLGSIQKLELDPFGEKLPEVGGTNEAGIKQRKLQRNKQVLSEQFDDWEEAFKRENEQKKLDEFFMREAILEAKKGADTWEVPIGAVLVQNGKIIARGCNMVEELRDSTAHAEMICIREASNLIRTWRLAETTLYVTLEPCPMCAGAILQARIDTVVWGAPNRLLGADGSWVRLFPVGGEGSNSMNPPSRMVGPVHPFHPNITIRRGVLETECGGVMQQFFKLRRKKDKRPESPPPPSNLPISTRTTKFFSKLHNIFCMMFCL